MSLKSHFEKKLADPAHPKQVAERTVNEEKLKHRINWSCKRPACSCRIPSPLVLIPSADIGIVREAIRRGHARRSSPCQLKNGTKFIEVIFPNGMKLSFGAFQTLPEEAAE
jgi:hypothetical protein